MFEEYFKQHEIAPIRVSKNEILQYPGALNSKAFYVKSGLLRSYLIDDNGKEHIFMFAPEGWLISDIEAHTLSVPAELYIEALEESEIVIINEATAYTSELASRNNKQLVEKLLRRIAVLQRRVILLMSAPAKQRYEHFIETYPQLTSRVPLKMIASYLGITPEALSNIRSKIRDQK